MCSGKVSLEDIEISSPKEMASLLEFNTNLLKQLHLSDSIQADSQARSSIISLFMEGRARESGKE